MSESVAAKELRYLEQRGSKCPCGRCENCELAQMVRNNRKILMILSNMKDSNDSTTTQEANDEHS